MKRLLSCTLLLAVASAAFAQPKAPEVYFKYVDTDPLAAIGLPIPTGEYFVPFVIVFVRSDDPSVHGYLVTVEYTDANNARQIRREVLLREQETSVLVVKISQATSIAVNARPFSFRGPLAHARER